MRLIYYLVLALTFEIGVHAGNCGVMPPAGHKETLQLTGQSRQEVIYQNISLRCLTQLASVK